MGRKAISDDTQRHVLLKSRRRCCLCFWLDQIDDVRPGQIAHLDGNNENADEDNLVFLCLEHHDQYDGRTSQSKGFKESEVRVWRDELYKEMAWRSRTIQNRSVQLTIVGVVVELSGNRREPRYFQIRFRLKNTGTAPVRTPTVAIGLPDGVGPKAPQYVEMGPLGHEFEFPDVNPCSFDEYREDFFEPNGRVAIATPLPPLNPVLIPGHSATFDGLALPIPEFSLGTELRLPYRVDAEDMDPVSGELQVKVPDDAEQLIFEQ